VKNFSSRGISRNANQIIPSRWGGLCEEPRGKAEGL
jgi:hypothetical protein